MDILSALPLLFIVNAYLFLALMVFALSANDLVCYLYQGARRHRAIKFMVAVPLMLSCLAALAYGLFAIGMAHGSRPEGYQVALFILGCLAPFVMLIFWAIGSLYMDALWAAITTAIFVYLLFFNPAIYIEYWADSNIPSAQMWMARHYSTGQGGLAKSESTARKWYKRAALNGNIDAQYKMASTARRNSEARKWYLLAAEQGHADAMVQMARLGSSEEERQRWLKRAVNQRHPEAVFMLAKQLMASDLPKARQLLLDAAENGSRTAIVFLITQYRQGGVLFGQNDAYANQWLSALGKAPPSLTEPAHLTRSIIVTTKQTQPLDKKVSSDETDMLYKQAQLFLHHPAKDKVLHDRALEYLTRAANKGHSESAVELAKLAMQKDQSTKPNAEALKWYEMAAANDNLYALAELTRYYKNQPNVDVMNLEKSLEYNGQLLDALQASNQKKRPLEQQHWAGEYGATQKRIERLKRLGGSWEVATEQAEKNPQKEFQLAKELLNNRQYVEGMRHMKSAAQRGNPEARFELAQKTLRGPRSFTQEIEAISELQALDQLGFLTASLKLGGIYQSGTGIVPRNYYLARQLFRKALADPLLSEKAVRLLKSAPDFTDSLKLKLHDDYNERIEAWYLKVNPVRESHQQESVTFSNGGNSQELDKVALRQQYETLLDHFRDLDALKRQATANDAKSQYQLAQSLQSYNLEEAIQWLQRAAKNGDSNAQYELAVRMIRGKKNTAEIQRDLKNWPVTAAKNGHVGAMVFLAVQYKNGYGGFEKNTGLAKYYYLKALQSTDADILYHGKIAGRTITIRRSNIQKALE